MARKPSHLSARLKHLPITPPKRPSSQGLFERASLGRKKPDISKPSRPSTDDQYFWQYMGTTSAHAGSSADEDTSRGASVPFGPFRNADEALKSAEAFIGQLFYEKLKANMPDMSSDGGEVKVRQFVERFGFYEAEVIMKMIEESTG